MIRKRTIKISLIIFSAILILGLGLISCFYLFVPGYVETEILPAILKKSGIALTHLNVRAIGPGGAEISDVKIGPDDGGILIDSIRLDYTPSGLFNRHINRVVLRGISINAVYENDRLSIAGLDDILNKKDNGEDESKTAPPVTIGEIIIANSDLNLWYEGKNFRVPFEISASSFDQGFLPQRLILKVYPDLNGFYGKDKNGKGWVTVNISTKDYQRFDGEISPFVIDYANLPVDVQISGSVKLEDNNLKGEIRAITKLVIEKSPPSIDWTIKIDKTPEKVRMQMKGTTNKEESGLPFLVSFDNTDLKIISPEIDALLIFDKGTLSGEYTFTSEEMALQKDKMSFSLPYVSIKGMVREDGDDPKGYVSSFSLNSREFALNSPGINANCPEYLIKGEIGYSAYKDINLDAGVKLKRGFVSMENGALQLKGITGEIPFSWPLNKDHDKGSFHVGSFTYGAYTFGPLDLKIAQKNGDLSFAGTVKYPALADMIINLKGSTSLTLKSSATSIKADIAAYQPAIDIDLGKFTPELKGYKFNGLIKTHGELNLANSSIKSGLDITLEKGTLTNREKKLTLEDVSLNASLDDLFSFQSPPGQKIKIGKVSMGDITATDLNADFRVESLSSIFIEQAGFKWSEGNINLQSFRVDTKKDEYLITLFCDRLMLADILEQFGVAGVSGGGTVNGRIPVAISKGKITFKEGFLYSTPGGGGKINIKGTDVFKEGMAPGSPEYIQMDIASEALKAFDYSWVKLSLDSNDGELAVKLQFDGKPENKLPFRYNKDLNSFMRVETTSEGSNFQGISLDVNLKLPLDELLNYKGALDMIK